MNFNLETINEINKRLDPENYYYIYMHKVYGEFAPTHNCDGKTAKYTFCNISNLFLFSEDDCHIRLDTMLKRNIIEKTPCIITTLQKVSNNHEKSIDIDKNFYIGILKREEKEKILIYKILKPIEDFERDFTNYYYDIDKYIKEIMKDYPHGMCEDDENFNPIIYKFLSLSSKFSDLIQTKIRYTFTK